MDKLAPLKRAMARYVTAEEFVLAQQPVEVPIDAVLPTDRHTKENTIDRHSPRHPDQPLRVTVNAAGQLQIEDGNHRYYDALRRGLPTVKIVFGTDAPSLNFQGEFTRISHLFQQAKEMNEPTRLTEDDFVGLVTGLLTENTVTTAKRAMTKTIQKSTPRKVSTYDSIMAVLNHPIVQQRLKTYETKLMKFDPDKFNAGATEQDMQTLTQKLVPFLTQLTTIINRVNSQHDPQAQPVPGTTPPVA